MTEQERLDFIAANTKPCPAPNCFKGYDLCATHGESWPCTATKVAWAARGLDFGTQARAEIDALPRPSYYYED